MNFFSACQPEHGNILGWLTGNHNGQYFLRMSGRPLIGNQDLALSPLLSTILYEYKIWWSWGPILGHNTILFIVLILNIVQCDAVSSCESCESERECNYICHNIGRWGLSGTQNISSNNSPFLHPPGVLERGILVLLWWPCVNRPVI